MVLCVCVGYDVYFAGHSEAVPPCHPAAGTIGLSLANFRRFWAVAARVNSSWTPHGPRNRSRPSPRMRLRCANSISTFLRRLCAVGLNSDGRGVRRRKGLKVRVGSQSRFHQVGFETTSRYNKFNRLRGRERSAPVAFPPPIVELT